MIVVKVELHSAITCEITELGRMVIDNVGGTRTRGNYRARVARKGQELWEGMQKPQREGRIENHPRLSQSVWCLVAKALHAAGYTKHVVDDTNEPEKSE